MKACHISVQTAFISSFCFLSKLLSIAFCVASSVLSFTTSIILPADISVKTVA